MEIKRPLLLISNDDGYQSKGLRELVEMVSDLGDIIVCAPDDARSGYSCAFSATTPLRLTQRDLPLSHNSQFSILNSQFSIFNSQFSISLFSCNGTPVDCVKIALSELCPRRPDIIIGGINHGDNASVNAHYSGTMGVTLEGCMKYIPSVAFSLCDFRDDADFSPLRPLVREITQRILAEGLPKGVCLNVNFPLIQPSPTSQPSQPSLTSPTSQPSSTSPYKGVKVCRMSYGTWGGEVTKCHHPRGYDYWWMVGHYTNDEPEAEDTDRWALDHGYVAITPTQIDLTAHSAIDTIKSWNL